MTPQEIEALIVEGLTDKVESLSTMVELLKAERDAAMREASELAMSIWRAEFQKLSPDFELCDSPAGVISQIDNMYVAMRDERDALAAQVETLRSAYHAWLESDFDDMLVNAFESTPQQCLRDVQAEAVMQAVQFFKPARDIDTKALEAYAATLRQGGAE